MFPRLGRLADRALSLIRRHQDHVRQALNVVFAAGQVATTIFVLATGADRITSGDPSTTTRLVPEGYTFQIWGLIYAASIGYALYQARPARRADPLLRRIGFPTAIAFAGTSLWLIVAQLDWIWLTVGVFYVILIALLAALAQITRRGEPRSTAERYLVDVPVSVYAGWASVATFANVSTALKTSGWAVAGAPEIVASVGLLAGAGLTALAVTVKTRGNLPYALTVLWALAGIVVAGLARGPLDLIALIAAGEAIVIALALVRARGAPPQPRASASKAGRIAISTSGLKKVSISRANE